MTLFHGSETQQKPRGQESSPFSIHNFRQFLVIFWHFGLEIWGFKGDFDENVWKSGKISEFYTFLYRTVSEFGLLPL